MAQAATDYAEGRVITRPRHDDKFRASCMVLLEAAGYPEQKGALNAVARSQGVEARTLSRWFNGENNPAIGTDVIEQRATLAALLEDIALKHAANAANPDLVADTSARDSAVVMGIAFDKLQVLQKLSPEDAGLLMEFKAATALVGLDGSDVLRRLISRFTNQAEASNGALLSG